MNDPAERPLLAGLRAELGALGGELREMAALRWELARLELQADLRSAGRLAVAWLAGVVMALTALPLFGRLSGRVSGRLRQYFPPRLVADFRGRFADLGAGGQLLRMASFPPPVRWIAGNVRGTPRGSGLDAREVGRRRARLVLVPTLCVERTARTLRRSRVACAMQSFG